MDLVSADTFQFWELEKNVKEFFVCKTNVFRVKYLYDNKYQYKIMKIKCSKQVCSGWGVDIGIPRMSFAGKSKKKMTNIYVWHYVRQEQRYKCWKLKKETICQKYYSKSWQGMKEPVASLRMVYVCICNNTNLLLVGRKKKANAFRWNSRWGFSLHLECGIQTAEHMYVHILICMRHECGNNYDNTYMLRKDVKYISVIVSLISQQFEFYWEKKGLFCILPGWYCR
jgi:hypothetical protein